MSAFNPYQIRLAGERMVNCALNCHGVSNVPVEGKIPRCLYIENEKGNLETGCIIVGLNPGQSNKDNSENQTYITQGISYKAIENHWLTFGLHHQYYKKLKKLVLSLGYDGPILWTELVKCESGVNTKVLPLSTMRKCVNEYLLDELNNTPSDWPIFAVGKEAYKALAYIYPDRTIIGVPHSTGSFGHFNRIMGNGKINEVILSQIKELVKGSVIWLENKQKVV